MSKNAPNIPNNRGHKRNESVGTPTSFKHYHPDNPDDNLCIVTMGDKKIQFYLDPKPGKTHIQTNIGEYRIEISNKPSNTFSDGSSFCSTTSTTNKSDNIYNNNSPKFYYPSTVPNSRSIFNDAKPTFPNKLKHSDIEPCDNFRFMKENAID